MRWGLGVELGEGERGGIEGERREEDKERWGVVGDGGGEKGRGKRKVSLDIDTKGNKELWYGELIMDFPPHFSKGIFQKGFRGE